MSSRGSLIRSPTVGKENAAVTRTSEGKGFDHRRALREISDNHPKKSIQKKPIVEDAEKSKKNVPSKTIQSVSCQTEGCNTDEVSLQTDESFLGMQASYKQKYEDVNYACKHLEAKALELNSRIRELFNEVEKLKQPDAEHADCRFKREYDEIQREYKKEHDSFLAVVAVLRDEEEENQNLKKELELLRQPSTEQHLLSHLSATSLNERLPDRL